MIQLFEFKYVKRGPHITTTGTITAIQGRLSQEITIFNMLAGLQFTQFNYLCFNAKRFAESGFSSGRLISYFKRKMRNQKFKRPNFFGS